MGVFIVRIRAILYYSYNNEPYVRNKIGKNFP